MADETDDPTPFQAHSTISRLCPCGCGTIKLLLLDADDVVRSSCQFTPEGWLGVLEGIVAECRKVPGFEKFSVLVDGEGVQQVDFVSRRTN